VAGSKYRNWILVVILVSMPVGLWTVGNELLTPGYCPPYPVLRIPACFVVSFYFILILVSQFIHHRTVSQVLYHFGTFAGLATATWFSLSQLQGNAICPILFSIPLCYAAFVDFLALITLNLVWRINERKFFTD